MDGTTDGTGTDGMDGTTDGTGTDGMDGTTDGTGTDGMDGAGTDGTLDDPEITISDPCDCENPLNFTNGDDFYVQETVTITGPAGATWTLVSDSSNGLFDGTATAIDTDITIVETAAGEYTLIFYHIADVGYNASFTNGTDVLSVDNVCSDCTSTDGTDADGAGTDGMDATGTDGTDADGTGTDGTDADGAGTDGTDADGTGTDADGTGTDGMDGTDADGAGTDGTVECPQAIISGTPVVCNEEIDGDISVNLDDFLAGGTNGTWSGDGVSGSMFDSADTGLGQFEVTYTIAAEGDCEESSASVVVYVVDCNEPPVGFDIDYLAAPGTASVAFNILANGDFDPDGDDITVTDIESPAAGDGSISFDADGNIVFDLGPDLIGGGSVTMTYTISDGVNSSTATVTIIISDCTAQAGFMDTDLVLICNEELTVEVDEATGYNMNAGYTQAYVLTDTDGGIIEIADEPEFEMPGAGDYDVYAINYEMASAPDLSVSNILDLVTQQSSACLDVEATPTPMTVLEPIGLSFETFCNPTVGGGYFATVYITGGLPEFTNSGSYTINTIPPQIEWDPEQQAGVGVVGPIPNDILLVVNVDNDGFLCGEGPFFIGPDACEITCDPTPGVMPDAVVACDGDDITVEAMGLQVDENEIFIYAMHTNSDASVGTVLATNTTGTFSLPEGSNTNTTYYISTVVGPDEDGNGIPDLDSPCTAVNAGTPVVFLDPIVIDHEPVCADNEEVGEFVVNVALNGGLPAFDGSNYMVVIDVDNAGGYIEEMNGSITFGPFPDGNGYTISVVDDNGCEIEVVDEGVADCGPTPIELLSFGGEVMTAGNYLTWVTATEVNNDFFTLYRSTDGTNFEAITEIAGAGTDYNENSYNFMDATAPSGVSYYRLDQTDFDGTTASSEVISLVRDQVGFSITTIAPTPAVEYVDVSFLSGDDRMVELNVIDLLGRNIGSFEINATTGNNTLRLDLNEYAVGVYFIQLDNGDSVLTQKFIKD